MSAPLNISAEELSLISFEDFEKQNYPLRLAYYKDNKYFYKGEFSARTNGIGETRFFRAYLNEFIKSYKPELINKEKDLWLYLKENGEFVVTKGENGETTVDLSQKDFFMYNLLCFLNLVRFWDEFNEIRNFNTERTPVIIKLPDNCDFNCIVEIINEKKVYFVVQNDDLKEMYCY